MRVIKPENVHCKDFIKLIKRFEQEGIDEGIQFGFNYDDLEKTYYGWIQSQPGLMLEHNGEIIGCIAGIVVPFLANYSTLYCLEHIWYVVPEYRDKGGGIRLLRTFEKVLKEMGVKKLIMAHSLTFKARYFRRLYKRLGYKPLEAQYIKDIL